MARQRGGECLNPLKDYGAISQKMGGLLMFYTNLSLIYHVYVDVWDQRRRKHGALTLILPLVSKKYRCTANHSAFAMQNVTILSQLILFEYIGQ